MQSNEVRSRKPIHNGNERASANDGGPIGAKIELRELPSNRLNMFHWIVLFLSLIGIYWFCCYSDNILPLPLSATVAKLHSFSEERARDHLNVFAGFGPRPSGSEACEVKAFNYIMTQLKRIEAIAKPNLRVEIDTQFPSDCFYMKFLERDFVTCYKNVSNIMIRIGPKPSPTQHSVLVNCHFDTVPDSPGASDDAVSCALMLEMLNLIAQDDKALQFDIIFLFNGAEENFLQAAHGFITQHPWRHSIRTFINLEAAGAGGREILFQAGPGNPWLLQTYLENAPHPHGAIIGQEVFNSGIIPSDTDFRIFRDHGRISGLDIAFVKNGYVYHTEFDTPDMIPAGAIQRAGENVLSTLRALANSSFLAKPGDYEQERLVFFDVLGYFSIYYSYTIGQFINLGVAAVAFYRVFSNIRKHGERFTRYSEEFYSLKDFILALCIMLLAIVLCAVVPLLVTQLITVLNLVMMWYSRRYFIVPLYVAPGVMTSYLLLAWAQKRFYSKRNQFLVERLYFDVAQFFHACIIVLLAYIGLASGYFVMLMCIVMQLRPILVRALHRLFGLHNNNAQLVWVAHLICVLQSMLYGCYCVLELYHIFIPITGRSGSKINPEILIAAMAISANFSIVLDLGSLVFISGNVRRMVRNTYFCCALTILVCLCSYLSIPYAFSKDAPTLRRVHFQHISRKVYNLTGDEIFGDSGIWIVPMDFRGSKDLPQYTFASASKPAPECCAVNDTYCGFPYYIPVKDMFFEDTRWMESPSVPYLPVKLKMEEISRSSLADGAVNISFSVFGPDHVTIFITPLQNWELREWSFTRDHDFIEEHSTFLIYLAYGRQSGPWEFWFVLEPPVINVVAKNNEAIYRLASSSHFIHGEHQNSEPVKNLIKVFHERRNKADLAYGWWRWMCTVGSWSTEYVSREY